MKGKYHVQTEGKSIPQSGPGPGVHFPEPWDLPKRYQRPDRHYLRNHYGRGDGAAAGRDPDGAGRNGGGPGHHRPEPHCPECPAGLSLCGGGGVQLCLPVRHGLRPSGECEILCGPAPRPGEGVYYGGSDPVDPEVPGFRRCPCGQDRRHRRRCSRPHEPGRYGLCGQRPLLVGPGPRDHPGGLFRPRGV